MMLKTRIKTMLHRLAIRAEGIADRFRPLRGRRGRIAIEPYVGWNEGDRIVLRGRVLRSSGRARTVAGQSVWTNIRQIAALFLTNEMADVPVTSGDVTTRSDEEGYFLLRRAHDAARRGWVSMPVSIVGVEDSQVEAPALLTPPDARYLVISDIDDTVLKTGAHSILRNLFTTFTGNALTRRVFADAPPFLDTLHAGGLNPVFYVSSSPWNLHALLVDIFERNGVVRGPLFLRDLGISETQFIKSSHGSHKGTAIDTIMAANPELPAVLVGDTGQHDAEVYHEAVSRWPGRVRAVVLRDSVRDSAQSRTGVQKLEAAGIPTFVTDDFMGVADEVARAMAG